MKAIFYRTENKINGKFYYGVKTLGFSNDRTYLGSGKRLKLALKKYGRKSFIRRTIFTGTPDECYNLEKIMVDDALLNQENCYNLAPGGFGGKTGRTPWNKGKTGIYSAETIEKIRKGGLGNKNAVGNTSSKQQMLKRRSDERN